MKPVAPPWRPTVLPEGRRCTSVRRDTINKRVAPSPNLRFTVLGKPKSRFCSQIGHFASDALSWDLNPRSSTHNQMKAELELFPAVSIAPVFFCRGPKLWNRAFSSVMSYEFVHNFRRSNFQNKIPMTKLSSSRRRTTSPYNFWSESLMIKSYVPNLMHI